MANIIRFVCVIIAYVFLADLGQAWHQQQLQQAKASSESKAGISAFPANYFLDDKFRQLVAEGMAERPDSRDSLPVDAREGPKLQKEHSRNSYSLGAENGNESNDEDDHDQSASSAVTSGPRRSLNGSTDGDITRQDLSVRDSRDREADHRLSDSNYRLSGTGSTSGRLHDHIRSGTRGGALQLERHGSGGDEDDLAVEQLNDASRSRVRRPRGGSRSDDKNTGDIDSDDGGRDSDREYSGGASVGRSLDSGDSAVATAAAAKTKKKAPPPAPSEAPPPRRAADLQDDSDEEDGSKSEVGRHKQPARASIDTIISAGGRRGEEGAKVDSYSDEEDDTNRVDLKVSTNAVC